MYGAGLVLYSALFIYSANVSPVVQLGKIFVAAAHCLVLLLPAYLTQSRVALFRMSGYALIVAFFLYAIFLVGFFPYFGFVPELYTFDTGSLSDLGSVIEHYFKQLFGWREMALLSGLAALLFLLSQKNLPKYGLFMLGFPALLYTASVSQFGGPGASQTFGNVTMLRRFGPVGFSYVSLSDWTQSKGGYLAEVSEFPGKVSDLVGADQIDPVSFVPSVPKVSRVILLQIESFDPESIDADLEGRKVMPFVSDLKSRCLNYTNFFAMKGAGGSADAEFAVATGLVPSNRLPALKLYDFSKVRTLYDTLADEGIVSHFAHNNQSGFYGRNRAYAQLAIKTQFQSPNETTHEIDFADSALQASLSDSRKVFHYFFNFESHGPYSGYSDETQKRFSISSKGDLQVDYLASMSEVDLTLERLFDRQREQFENGENLVIIIADHPSYLHSEPEVISRHRIPAMICHRDFDGRDIPTIFASVDLYPTILEAFGLKPEGPFVGHSMFHDVRNAALLPIRMMILPDGNGSLTAKPCGPDCEPYFAFTEQYIRLN